MTIRLDDPRIADEIRSLVDRRIAYALQHLTFDVRYGTVTAVDTVTGRASVAVGASPDASPGFTFPAYLTPGVGDVVRVVMRGADRYIDAVLTGIPELGGDLETYRIRLAANNDASLASTLHALQIGQSDGVNLIMDGNELMARNNGAAATLYINNEGGEVVVNGPLSPLRIGRSVVANTTQNVATATTVRITHQVATWVDDGSTTYTSGTMTVSRGGMYLVSAHTEYQSTAGGPWRILGIGRAGGGHPTTWGGFGTPSNNTYAVSYGTPGIGTLRHHAFFVVPLAGGDSIASFAYQDSGSTLTVSNSELTILRIGA